MSKLNNVVIVGKKDYILAINFDKVNDQTPNCVFFDNTQLPVSKEKNSATAMNSLYALCIYMEKLKVKKTLNQLEQVSFITIPDIIYDKINKGTYKTWVVNKKYSNGEAIDPLELSLWTKFSQLFNSDLGEYIVFRPLSRYNIKKPKYNAELVFYINSLIKLSWEAIAEHEMQSLNICLDAVQA